MTPPRTNPIPAPPSRLPQSRKNCRRRFRSWRSRGSPSRSMNSSLASIIGSRSPRHNSVRRSSLRIISLLSHRMPSQHRRRRGRPSCSRRNGIALCHSSIRESSSVRYAHHIVRCCCRVIEIARQDIVSSTYIILIHEMPGTISDAMDIPDSTLIILFAINSHSLEAPC